MFNRWSEPRIASKQAAPANQRFTRRSSFLRLTMSARAPARKAKKKNGSAATVDIKDSRNGEDPSIFIVQVAAVSCAATQVPENKMANQNFRYTGFRRAAKVEFL